MPTLTMPTSPGFARVRFGLRTNTQAFVSPLSGSVQTAELAGARWVATFQLPAMNRVAAAPWLGFLTELGGPAGRFFGFDPDRKTPRGVPTGTPLTQGTSSTGKNLYTDGWTPLATGNLLKGDYIEVNGELFMVTDDSVDADSSGQAAISVIPAIRTTPPNNSALRLGNASDTPRAVMMLVDDEQAFWDSNNQEIVQPISFSAMQVFT